MYMLVSGAQNWPQFFSVRTHDSKTTLCVGSSFSTSTVNAAFASIVVAMKSAQDVPLVASGVGVALKDHSLSMRKQ